jgi:hypothetical protein
MKQNIEEYKTLLHAILRQAIDDYVKLQHPKFRNKKYLQEAFDSAVQLFFDSEYRFLFIKNEDNEEMSLKNLITELLEDDRANIDNIKKHVINNARTFWETKLVRTLYIPDSFIYDGHVYIVHHIDEPDPHIDFEKKEIFINKKEDSENELQFLQTALSVVFYHEDIASTQKKIDQLGRALFRMLKINSCFTGS